MSRRGTSGPGRQQLDEHDRGDHQAQQAVLILAEGPVGAIAENPTAEEKPGAYCRGPTPRQPETSKPLRHGRPQIHSNNAEPTNATPIAVNMTTGSGMGQLPRAFVRSSTTAMRRSWLDRND